MKNIISLLFVSVFIFSCSDKKDGKNPLPKIEELSSQDSLLKNQLPDTITGENHSMIMDMILGKPKFQIKSIGILVYDGVNDLDFMGPRYVFGQSGVRPKLIALKPGTFKTVMGVEIVPDVVYDSIDHLDILVIPGGFKGTIEASYDEKLLAWIRMIDKTTIYTSSVCTGGWILGATGLLKGKKASTNWYREEEFLKKYGALPGDERYTKDGKYWTSAGVTAGMDMAIAIINENWGEKYAQGVMLDMEYDPAPPIQGGTPDNTGWLVKWMMKSMYDAGVNPLIDSLEQVKKINK